MGQHSCLFPALAGKIVEVCRTQAAFATAINMSKATLSAKMNGKTPWTSVEMVSACKVLGVSPLDAGYYFLPESCENGTSGA